VLVRGEARLAFDWETVLQMMAIIACLMLIRSRTNNPELHVFYLMFLPVVWMAGRHGLAGAVTAVALAQVGLILTIANLAHTVFDLTTYQGMMLVLALTGLALGITVNERRRSEQQLRAQQESYARLSRIDTIGEFSVSLAHEINQPLTAAATYARLAIEDLEQPADAGRTAARENIFRSLRQIERASDIVRQLRAFIQRGPSRREAASLNQLIDEAIEMTRLEIERTNTQIVRDEAAELMVPAVEADPMQIKQVLINLLTNALAAVRRTARGQPRLHIATKLAADGFIDVRIEDNGPGFAADILSRPFEPFGTARTEGLGVGLALCRSIVEAHGGRIWLDNTAGGAVVGFTLKAIEEDP
jgi:C4-dicarboxylate-specific signal transduction histidine kinase